MFNPARQLQTTPLSVSQLFERGFFVVPSNQRLYRWGENQWKKLWDDLITTIEEDFESSGGELIPSQHTTGHFLGAVVLIGSDTSHPDDRWSIIDGQQRLTTISILASCVSQYLGHVSERRTKKKLDATLTSIFTSTSADYAPRIVLNREDDFYTQSTVINLDWDEKLSFWDSVGDDNSEVQRSIKECYKYFYEVIGEYLSDKSDKSTYVCSLADALSQNLYLLQVKADNAELAYTLFETLNERGLGLTQADLIRNKLIEYADQDGQDKAERVVLAWGKLLDYYEDQSQAILELPQLIQFSYSSRHDMVKKDKIFEEVSKGLDTGRFQSIELVRQFSTDAYLWSSFLQGNLSEWTPAMSFSQSAILGPVWKEHCAPFIVSIMDKYSGEIPTVERAFLVLENFLFREGVVNRQTVSTLQSVLTKAAKLVRADVEFDEIVEYLRGNSQDKIFLENFKLFVPKNMRQAFYVIYKIENYNLTDVGFTPDPQSTAQHLEHIMPKKPGDDWNGIQDVQEFNSYLNRIGNLLILEGTINRAIKNRSLQEKIGTLGTLGYKDSGLTLPKEVLSREAEWYPEGNWGFRSIELRQNYLAETYACSVWAL